MLRLCLLALTLLLPAAAHAQDLDLLAPLAPRHAQKKKRKRRRTHPHHKPAPAAEPLDDLSVLAPLQLPTALGVKVGEGVKGAQVFVDGQAWGEAPIPPRVLAPGAHQLRVKRSGFADYLRTVEVPKGHKVQVEALLDATSGVLAVETTPAGAEVLIDGKKVGETPLAGVLLAPGSYELRVRHPGFMNDVSRIAVRAGRDYPVRLKLVPQPAGGDRPAAIALAPTGEATEALPGTSPRAVAEADGATPWYKHWYVWAGVGVIAAAATAGVVAASGGSSGPPISAQAVCGGACDGVLSPP